MKLVRLLFFLLFYLLISFYNNPVCYSQKNSNTSITGLVIDEKTKEPLPFVSVALENTTTGGLTDIKGYYSIVTIATSYKIKFSFVGYQSESRVITPGKHQVINIELKPSSIELKEVIVKPAKQSYRNKDNPAVGLIEKVIKNKYANRMSSLDYYDYNKYEKLVFSLSNLSENFKQPRAFSKFQFVLENVDSSRQDGRKNVPMYIKESQSQYFYRKDPKADKEIITAEKTIKFDEYVDNRGLSQNIKYLYQDIDIYSNEIFFLSNKFLSPVAPTAPLFYRYFIIDTSMVDNTNCIKMFFEPRNPADFLFHGFLFITNDSVYAIRKIDMSFNKGINIDWVNDVRIIQEFEKIQEKVWFLTKDEVAVDFGVSQNMMGLYGEKKVYFNKYSINNPIADSVFKGPEKTYRLHDADDNPKFWEAARLTPLSKSENALYSIVDSVKKIPAFRRRMDIIMVLTSQFLDVGKVEFGPAGTFYSFNQIEGSRVRFGGRTTAAFNKRIYFDSYLAYGFKDEQFKYNVGATYSLSGKAIYKFPVKSIRLNYQYETQTPGQVLQYATQDNILLSFKRGVDDKIFYNRILKLEYLNEFENHFSYALGYNYQQQAAGGNLYFTTSDTLPQANNINNINISEAFLRVRYAPNEKFYQGKIYRTPIPSRFPVIQLQGSLGIKDLNSDYDYQKIRMGISRRFYFSIVGYTDFAVEAGKVFGQVPYPLLFIHNANQTYSYQKNSYNMMNFLEFVSDKYFSVNIDHSFNGFFFNKVPLLKKLKFREVATFKLLYGGVSDKNDPALNDNLLRFPTDLNGSPFTYSLEKKPYIEGSIGISNILRIFRIDLIKRFTYLDNPNVSSLGVRVQFRLDI